jgi:hypothetical protein
MADQRKTWLGILAIGVATTAMPSVARADLVLIGATAAANFVDLLPLPGALPLFAIGLAGLGLISWRRKKKGQV